MNGSDSRQVPEGSLLSFKHRVYTNAYNIYALESRCGYILTFLQELYSFELAAPIFSFRFVNVRGWAAPHFAFLFIRITMTTPCRPPACLHILFEWLRRGLHNKRIHASLAAMPAHWETPPSIDSRESLEYQFIQIYISFYWNQVSISVVP